MRLRYIDRTSTLAWSPVQHESLGPLLATGTAAGALDASFSTTAELEIWDLSLQTGGKKLRKNGGVSCPARFNRLAWGVLPGDVARPLGILASGMENGELDLWNPKSIIDGDNQKSLLMRHNVHSGPVRGLDFSPVQGNLLASGATDGEIYIWDLTNPTKPYTPGTKSQRLEDITTLAWNRQVAYILATASNNGSTVLWDLRHKKELITLTHPGGRKPITALAWNPVEATQLVTASEDDNAPVILVWDLRNASAPMNGLQGHQKGILSLSWCPKDSDLLLSSGKDNSTLAWNPTTGECIGELARSNNWAFDVQWCPRNPDLVAVSSFDGYVSVHSLQSSGAEDAEIEPTPIQSAPTGDIFDNIGINQSLPQPSIQFALRQPPKWLRRPVGTSFGFGGKLVTFDSTSRRVSIRTLPTEPAFARRADELEHVMADGTMETFMAFCDTRATATDEGKAVNETDREMWKFLKVLLESGAREQVLEYLGFDRSNVAGNRLAGLLRELKVSAHTKDEEPVVDGNAPSDTAQNVGVEPTQPNGLTGLFGNSQTEFPDITATQPPQPQKRPSEPFSLYSSTPGEESDIDTLITRAVVLGDFETAVDVALGANRLSDALMLAVSGGSDLLLRTQQEYFKRQAKKKSYVRVLQSVVNGDLGDVVESADLESKGEGGWKDVLALVCTYGKAEDSSSLFSVLGRRLEGASSSGDGKAQKADITKGGVKENKKFAAVLCYLAAGDLPKVVSIWSRREGEEEQALLSGAAGEKKSVTAYASHVVALQSLIEKVVVFRKAIGFVDENLGGGGGQQGWELEGLYERYVDYAEAVAGQGRVGLAWRVLEMVPEAFGGTGGSGAVLRDRVFGVVGGRGVRGVAKPWEIVDVVGRASVQQPQTVGRGYSAYQSQQPVYSPYSQPQQPVYAQPGFGGQPQQPGYYTQQPAVQQFSQPAQPGVYPNGQYGGQFGQGVGSTFTPPPPAGMGVSDRPQPKSTQHEAPATGFNDPPMLPPNPRLTSKPAPVAVATPFQQQTTTRSVQPPPPGPPSRNPTPVAPPPVGGYAPQPAFSPGMGRRTPGLSGGPGRMMSPPPQEYLGQAQGMQHQGFVPTPTPPPPTPPIGRVGGVMSPPPVHSTTMGMTTATGAATQGLQSKTPTPTPMVQRPPSVVPGSQYPSGDRSHIPPAHKPLYEGLQKYMNIFKNMSSAPQQKKMYDDAEKRIGVLYDQLNGGVLDEGLVGRLGEMVKAMDNGDFTTATRIQVDLMTTRYDAGTTGKWMLVVKRLIDCAEKVAGGGGGAVGGAPAVGGPGPMGPQAQQGMMPQHQPQQQASYSNQGQAFGAPPPPMGGQQAPPPPMGMGMGMGVYGGFRQ